MILSEEIEGLADLFELKLDKNVLEQNTNRATTFLHG